MAIVDALWSMFGNKNDGNKAARVKATVLSKDESGTVWVHIEGGVTETPVYSTTIDVSQGDTVMVRVEGGKAYIDGSTSDPSIGVKRMIQAIEPVAKDSALAKALSKTAKEASEAAQIIATEAQEAAQAVSQYFWQRSEDAQADGAGTGAFVTEETQEDFLEAAADGFPDLSDEHPHHNLLMNSLGILLRTGLKNLVSITRSAIAFYDGIGSEATNIVASFGGDGSCIGKLGESRLNITSRLLSMVTKNDEICFEVRDYRNESGYVQHESSFVIGEVEESPQYQGYWYISNCYEGPTLGSDREVVSVSLDGVSVSSYETEIIFGTRSGVYVAHLGVQPQTGQTLTVTYDDYSPHMAFTFGKRRGSLGLNSVAMGAHAGASGSNSFSAGNGTASGDSSHATNMANATGRFSSSENAAIASGELSHAEGVGSASGLCSHSEGGEGVNFMGELDGSPLASGTASHAEGIYSQASGTSAHAEGGHSEASGDYSHAQNLGAVAAEDAQTAIGKFNADETNAALIIGNGTQHSDRSNALWVTWQGRTVMGRLLLLRSDEATGISSENFVGLYVKTTNREAYAFRVFGGSDSYGDAIVIGDGGMLVVGAGESAESLYNAKIAAGSTPGNEDAYLSADGTVYIVPNCNTIANRIEYNFGSGGLDMKDKSITNTCNLELRGSGTSNGGWIDFHYSQSSADYTSRIIEDQSGHIDFHNTYLKIKTTAIDRDAANPSSDVWGRSIWFADANDEYLGQVRTIRRTDGRISLLLEAINEKSDGTQVSNNLQIHIARDGTQTYGVSNPANFRSAIGAGAVTGVKGGGESSYRTGNVNITRTNLSGCWWVGIVTGVNIAKGGTIGTNTAVFNYNLFLVVLSGGFRAICYRTGSTSSAGVIDGDGSYDDGTHCYGCQVRIAVATNGKMTLTSASSHWHSSSGFQNGTARNVTAVYGLV